MRPINIYLLTRIADKKQLQQLEKQMSKRSYFLTIKEWEILCLKDFAELLEEKLDAPELLQFHYSFQIPKLGKEFDLLRVSEETVINIELKSGYVSDEKIKRQLKQNRYYLSTLGKNIRSYTYIAEEQRLVRYTNGNRLVEEDWAVLCRDLKDQGTVYDGDLEDLFSAEKFLISPLTDPERFLRRDYFLTSQQNDIKKHILAGGHILQGFTGLPGTGKTLLLYDIAMELSKKDSVCVLHFGSYPEEMEMLDDLLKRIDFYHCRFDGELPEMDRYQAILIDEGHYMSSETFERIAAYANRRRIPVVVSYDREDVICEKEIPESIGSYLEQKKDFVKYRLTNRIRTNSELSVFIQNVMQLYSTYRRKDYPSVEVAYANGEKELAAILKCYLDKDYVYIEDFADATCREFEKVVLVLGPDFYYGEDGSLQSGKAQAVRHVFHGLSRAVSGIGIIVLQNEDVFAKIMDILQIKNRK